MRVLLATLFLAGLALGVLLVLVLHRGGAGAGTPPHEPAGGHSSASARRAAHRALGGGRQGGLLDAQEQAQVTVALPPGAAASFASLQARLAGPIEIAVVPVGSARVQAFGGERQAHGWSTTKVPVLTALLAAQHRLSATEQVWARSAITESNNAAILDLFGSLEALKGGLLGASQAVEDELRASGDQDTIVATEPPPPGAVTRFGQTDWRPANAVLFFSALDAGCLLSPVNTRYVLGLMQEIEPSESWGLGSAGFSHVAFKGGWGPEGAAYLVRQSGVIDPLSPRAVAIAIVAYPPPGTASFSSGVEMVTSAARWLHRELQSTEHAAAQCSPEAATGG